jgi:hypothetical protein
MKYILAILLFTSLQSFAQNKLLQIRDYVYRYDSATVSTTPFMRSDDRGVELRLNSNGNLLATIYSDGLVLWESTIAASSISDTLSATGITGMCRITVPTTINTQRVIQYGDWAIIYQTTTYTASSSQYGYLPITIRRNSDNVAICTIYNGWAVDWHVTPQWSWTGRVGTTRIKRITLP